MRTSHCAPNGGDNSKTPTSLRSTVTIVDLKYEAEVLLLAEKMAALLGKTIEVHNLEGSKVATVEPRKPHRDGPTIGLTSLVPGLGTNDHPKA